MKKLYFLLICAFGLILFFADVSQALYFDDFENGYIDSNLWVVGGEQRGSSYVPYRGDWDYSQEETDGYLQLNVSGPTSGLTYGAESWAQTTYDFNDGRNHILNFTWEPDFVDPHYNYFFIQMTDGFISSENNLHWNLNDYDGTENLFRYAYSENMPSPGPLEWSIQIKPRNTLLPILRPASEVTLYDEHHSLIFTTVFDELYNGTLDNVDQFGNPLEWYLRFMVSDGTSAGFPAGDASLYLYDFQRDEFQSKLYDLEDYFHQAGIEDLSFLTIFFGGSYLCGGTCAGLLAELELSIRDHFGLGFQYNEIRNIIWDDQPHGTPGPVPEPATILLLGTGLVGLAGFRRKVKK